MLFENTCIIHSNICNIQIKQLEHKSETSKIVENIHLEHACMPISTMQYPNEILGTRVWNTWKHIVGVS
jgi:hypothetical protein